MPSTFTWLDYSEQDRRRMVEVISLFSEKSTRDELGIGVVRDALSDLLFPGINTIQTRARYFLFIPWIYRGLEAVRTPANQFRQKGREQELALVAPLQVTGEEGIFGSVAGEHLQRLPSSIYWLGLGEWGIYLGHRPQTEYHRHVDADYRIREERRTMRQEYGRGEDGSREDDDFLRSNWHPHIPDPPPSFPDGISFNLTQEEAQFLCERIQMSVPRTLLAHLADTGLGGVRTDAAWQHLAIQSADEKLARELRNAQNFSLCMHGAALLYNLMLAEGYPQEDRIDQYHGELQKWAVRMQEQDAFLARWDFKGEFWQIVSCQNPRVAYPTRSFVNTWLALCLHSGSPASIAESDVARDLLKKREFQLKKGLARLQNRRALEMWNGAAGTGQIGYRWDNVQTILNDIDRGLGRG